MNVHLFSPKSFAIITPTWHHVRDQGPVLKMSELQPVMIQIKIVLICGIYTDVDALTSRIIWLVMIANSKILERKEKDEYE